MLSDVSKKVKLGIDAKWFFEGPPSGNMVVKNLVNEMLQHNDENFELYLIMNRKHKEQAIEHFPAGTKMVFLLKLPNMISNALLLPLVAWRYGINIMLFQNFSSIWAPNLFKIVYIHDVLFLDYPQYYSLIEKFYFRQMKSLAKKADWIITISETEKQRMISNHIGTCDSISVVYHGIHKNFKPLFDHRFETLKAAMNKYDLPEKYLLYVGRVNIRKNLTNLIKSMTLLDDTQLKLVIVGERPEEDTTLEDYIIEQHLFNRVIFTGHVPEEDLYLIYANATVFCFPSYAEGFGLPPLEAMQCGVPVIVSNRTAMPEICGEAATYINPDDVMDIAKKINSILNNNRLYDEKRTSGIKHSSTFSWKKAANEILNLIHYAYVDRKNYKQA